MPAIYGQAIMNTVQRAVEMHKPAPLDSHSKENTMNSLRKNVLVALAALSLGGAAFAAEAPVPAQAPQQHQHMTKEQRQARMEQFFARRQAALHGALKITPAQEPAFNAFVASMKRDGHGERGQSAGLSAPERMQKHI